MPSLGEAADWLNSGPLGPAGMRGHVVLVNFWTGRKWRGPAQNKWAHQPPASFREMLVRSCETGNPS
jgi:hypothetical protein